VLHSLLAGKTLLVIDNKDLAEEIKSLGVSEVLVGGSDELGPRLGSEVAKLSIKVRIKSRKLILGHVLADRSGADNLGDLNELIVVITAVEEGVGHEDHASEHATERPDIKRVVIILHVDKKLGTLEVTRSNANVVLGVRVVELSKSPIDDAKLAVRMINHNVVRLDITVHDTTRVGKVKTTEELKEVEADIHISKRREESLEISVVNILEDKRASLGKRILNSINQVDNVGTTTKVLENLNLTTNLFLLDRLEDLDDSGIVSLDVDTGKDLRVFTATELTNNLVVLLRVPLRGEVLVVPISLGHLLVHISINSGNTDVSSRLLHVGVRSKDDRLVEL
jgi:hypothetical protein